MDPRENFTDEEWKNLVSLPFAVSMTVIVAAPSIQGAWGESKAMIQEPVKLAAESGSAPVDLVGQIDALMGARDPVRKEAGDLLPLRRRKGPDRRGDHQLSPSRAPRYVLLPGPAVRGVPGPEITSPAIL